MFDEKEFISLIKEKAKEKDLVKEVDEELKLYMKFDQLEYLYIVNEFVKRIKRECAPTIMFRQASANTAIGYILGFHHINPKEYPLFSALFFYKKYIDGNGPRFDISVPKSKVNEAIRILKEMTPINIDKSIGSVFYFGVDDKYRIGIYSSDYLDILCSTITLIKEDYGCDQDFRLLNDKKILDYMFAFDNKGYHMPNLYGCMMGIPKNIYSLMEACELHSLYDFALLNSIQYGIYKDKSVVIRSLKEDGIEGTICSKEQLLDILINRYDVEEVTALSIMNNLLDRHHLSEGEELVLKSYEVPDRIINQLNNINYLHYLSFSLEEVKVTYLLAKIKSFVGDEYDKVIPISYINSYVGPFFYICGRLYAYKEQMNTFNSNIRFFDSSMSHFDYFNSLDIEEGDYGNYPRGRVIFDNFQKRFIVYMDKCLMNDKVKDLIIYKYHLEKYKTIFKRDAHYTHDGL